MKNPLVLSCAALAISLIALVGVIVNSGTPLAKSSDVVAPAPGDTDQLLHRIDELADESRVLRNRIAMLESRPAIAQRVPVAVASVSPKELDAFKEEVQAELETLSTSSTDGQAMEEKIAVYLDKARIEEKVEMAAVRRAKREAKLEGNVEGMTTWLDLTPNQAESLPPSSNIALSAPPHCPASLSAVPFRPRSLTIGTTLAPHPATP
ncbi:MAG: DNA repair ATPase RecN, partial [Gammaproteobacteria bacterium]